MRDLAPKREHSLGKPPHTVLAGGLEVGGGALAPLESKDTEEVLCVTGHNVPDALHQSTSETQQATRNAHVSAQWYPACSGEWERVTFSSDFTTALQSGR